MKKTSWQVGMLFLCVVFVDCVFAGKVTVAWDANTDPAVAGYKLYIGFASRTYTPALDVGTATTFTLTDVQEGVNYFMAVTAYDVNGMESSFSQELVYNQVEGDGWQDNWTPATRSILPVGGTDFDEDGDTIPVLFFKGNSATVYNQASVDLTGLDLNNVMFNVKFRAFGVGSYKPKITLLFSGPVNITFTYAFTGSNSYGTTSAIFDLGLALNDGQWHVASRNLAADLQDAGFLGSVTGLIRLTVYSAKNLARAPLYDNFDITIIEFASNIEGAPTPQ
jgi:hypothetical protein